MVEVKLSKRAEQVLRLIHTWPREFLAEGSAHVLPGCGTHRPSGSDRNIVLTPTEWAQKKFTLHQATLAQQLGCSRWTIGRAIKKLKEAGLLMETGRDKQSRCKTYALPPFEKGGLGGISNQAPLKKIPLSPPFSKGEATPQGLVQLENYRRTFELNFIHWPDWEKHYAAVTWELKDVHCIHKLFRQTFDRLYEIRAACN